MKNGLLTKIALGATLILAPAVPDIGICIAPRAYAQEVQDKKEDFLEKRITNEIEGLQRKENKTAEEYMRLIELAYDFRKEKTQAFAKEAEEKTEKNTPENTYAKAMVSWLTKPQDKQNEALSLLQEILNSKKASNRLKSNAALRFASENTKANAELAIKLDRTNLVAYLDWIRKNHDEIIKFNYDLEAVARMRIGPEELERFLACYGDGFRPDIQKIEEKESETIRQYDYASRQKNPNKDYAQSLVYLVKIHEVAIKTLENICQKYLWWGAFSYDWWIKCMKKTNRICEELAKIYSSYENHMRKGIFNYKTRTPPIKTWSCWLDNDVERYDLALKAFQEAEKISITKPQKVRARLYQGLSLLDKAKYTDKFCWEGHDTPDAGVPPTIIKINAAQKRLAEKALPFLMEAVSQPERDECYTVEEYKEAIDGVQEILCRIK